MTAKRLLAGTILAAGLTAPGTLANANEGGGGGDPTLVPMPEIAVPIIDADQLEGKLRFTLVVQANDAAAAHEIGVAQPRLRAAAVAAGLEFARLRASPYRPVNVARLAQDLNAALRAVDPGVKQALIVKVMATES